MKSVLVTFVLLIGTGWLSTTVETPHPVTSSARNYNYGQDSWRRTANGWEDANAWRLLERPKLDVRAIHPTAVAAFTFFACVGGLVAFNPSHPPDNGDASIVR